MSRLSLLLAAMLCTACATASAQDTPDPVEERFFAVQKRLDVGGSSYRFGDYEGFLERLEVAFDELINTLEQSDSSNEVIRQLALYSATIKQVVRHVGGGEVLASGSSSKRLDGRYHHRLYMMLRPEAKGVFSMLKPPSDGFAAADILPAGTDILLDFEFSGSQWLGFIFETVGKALGVDAEAAEQLATSEEDMALAIDTIRTVNGECFLAIIINEAERSGMTLPNGITANLPEFAIVASFEGTSSLLVNLLLDRIRADPNFAIFVRAFREGMCYDIEIKEVMPVKIKPTLVWDGKRVLFCSNRDLLKGYLDEDEEGIQPLSSEETFKGIVGLAPEDRFALFYSSGVMQQELQSLFKLAGMMEAAEHQFKTLLYGGIHSTEPYLSVAHRDELGIGAMSVSNGEAGLLSGMGAAPMMVMAGVVSAIAVPSFIRAREISRRNACQENQFKLDAAKEQWALENNKPRDSTPTWGELIGPTNYIRTMPVCPSGGEYTMGTIDEYPYCSMAEQEDFPHDYPIE